MTVQEPHAGELCLFGAASKLAIISTSRIIFIINIHNHKCEEESYFVLNKPHYLLVNNDSSISNSLD